MSRIDRRRQGRYARDRTAAPRRTADSPIDAPYGRTRSGSAAGVVGQVDPGEVIAARTAVAMLITALRRRGLAAEVSGHVMLSVRRPGGNGQATERRTVLLGHHPHDSGRLWWWLRTADPARRAPDGGFGRPVYHAIGPVDEAAKVAHQIAVLLSADTAARE